ncbi:hypothetical protein GCM10011376_25980 [Nocardioides flavus (ex Wang et al. 2016)]|uniref:Uncharacterized protein n=1 Tax=Nocardioides flavus (ex Wang et al. 2016) TaxID=2058780 RepID=A0ABQ3HM42_9ACTN|nr:hypothetical protein GCM10011376_25980 [Nocardioides flavus (ex Wang et al. 2016)]
MRRAGTGPLTLAASWFAEVPGSTLAIPPVSERPLATQAHTEPVSRFCPDLPGPAPRMASWPADS